MLAIGLAGAAVILIAFVLNQFHIWKDTDLAYDAFNFFGGAALMLYALLISSWPFFVLNVVWTAVAARDLLLDLAQKPKPKGKVGHKTKCSRECRH